MAITTAIKAIKTENGLAISGLGNLVLLSFNKILPMAKNAITVKNDKAYTPAKGPISPLVTNKTKYKVRKIRPKFYKYFLFCFPLKNSLVEFYLKSFF